MLTFWLTPNTTGPVSAESFLVLDMVILPGMTSLVPKSVATMQGKMNNHHSHIQLPNSTSNYNYLSAVVTEPRLCTSTTCLSLWTMLHYQGEV